MVGYTVRVTRPSRSRWRRVSVSIRCEMPSMPRCSSVKRVVPWPSRAMANTLHLSPTRLSISRAVAHPSAAGAAPAPAGPSWMPLLVTPLCLTDTELPPSAGCHSHRQWRCEHAVTDEPSARSGAVAIDLTPYAEAVNSALAEGTFCVVATGGQDGIPDIGFKGSMLVFDREHLAYWERTRGQHLANLRRNPGVAVLYFSRARGKYLRLYGHASLH